MEKKYNHKSDIWSLGCILYELTTCKHPFEGRYSRLPRQMTFEILLIDRNMKILVNKIVRGSYVPIPAFYSSKLSQLISEMLSKNPRNRPSINAILRRVVIKDRIKVNFRSNEVHCLWRSRHF